MSLLYHVNMYLEFLILACTIYILAPSGVRGIIKNEKYKGDLLLQKTITTDPISKRCIENFGEEEQYYVHDHHEPIVSREVWEQAKEIRLSRNHPSDTKADGKREKYTKKYAFSSMPEEF